MKVKVLFVCLGNICRSPLAMNLFIHAVQERNLSSQFEIDSCGTSDYHIGASPDSRTIENAAKNGLDIKHEARQLTPEDLDRFDYVLAMDRSNLQDIKELDPAGGHAHKIHLMRDFDPLEKGAEVPDPYFGGEEGFQNVYNILKRSVNHFLDVVIKEHNLSTPSR
jgi:protein-tyrosine phosphatase